jgi:hypothetical protein
MVFAIRHSVPGKPIGDLFCRRQASSRPWDYAARRVAITPLQTRLSSHARICCARCIHAACGSRCSAIGYNPRNSGHYMNISRRTGVDLNVAFVSSASAPATASPAGQGNAPRVRLFFLWVARRMAKIAPARSIARSLALRIIQRNSRVENYCRALYREMRSGTDESLGSSLARWCRGLMASYAKKLLLVPAFRSVAFKLLRRNERLSNYCRRLVRSVP